MRQATVGDHDVASLTGGGNVHLVDVVAAAGHENSKAASAPHERRGTEIFTAARATPLVEGARLPLHSGQFQKIFADEVSPPRSQD